MKILSDFWHSIHSSPSSTRATNLSFSSLGVRRPLHRSGRKRQATELLLLLFSSHLDLVLTTLVTHHYRMLLYLYFLSSPHRCPPSSHHRHRDRDTRLIFRPGISAIQHGHWIWMCSTCGRLTGTAFSGIHGTTDIVVRFPAGSLWRKNIPNIKKVPCWLPDPELWILRCGLRMSKGCGWVAGRSERWESEWYLNNAFGVICVLCTFVANKSHTEQSEYVSGLLLYRGGGSIIVINRVILTRDLCNEQRCSSCQC